MFKFENLIKYLFSFSSNDRGNVFELYGKWFLENDPRYSAQIKKVWLWNDWPDNWGRDKGIDLIAETYCGKIWAVQTKAYNSDYYVTKEDVDKFLSESSRKKISFRLLIATTNNIGANAIEVIKAQEKPISTILLYQLEDSVLNWPENISKINIKQIKEKKDPKKHQQEAIDKILMGFGKSNIGQVHMACGTGKTLVGLWVVQNLKSNLTLVLVPSISLVGQLYHEWVSNKDDNFNFHPIFVCSDSTVYDKENEAENIVEKTNELGFPVTTNSQELLNEIKFTNKPKVIFSTYHSSPVVKEACQIDESLIFDITIADEAHRCAGKAKSYYATIVDDGAIKSKYKLFMTATPRIYSNNVKKIAGEINCEIISMDDDQKFGPVFYTLPFSKAIQEGLLTDYRVVISVMDNKTYQEYIERGRFITIDNHETDARTLGIQLLIAKAIKEYDLKKVITFHNRKKGAKDFIQSFEKTLELINTNDKPLIEYLDVIFGEMPQNERSRILKKLKENKDCSLIANVKCLSEGVDVPTLDGIAFIDPKGSEIDIVQAVGRVMRKPNNEIKKVGTIIIPVFIDQQDDHEISLDQSCFKAVWNVIKALRAHDDILAEELDNIRLELGKRTYKIPPKLTKIVLDASITINKDFNDSVTVKLIENCSVGRKWRSFSEAREFVINLSLKSESEWRLYIDNKILNLEPLPNDIPKAPWVAYKNLGWVNWGDFLGTNLVAPRLRRYRSYEEASIFAQSLKLFFKDKWFVYVKGNYSNLPLLPDDIPKGPDKTYKRKEYGNKWQGWRHFLGNSQKSNWYKTNNWRAYDDAKKFVKDLNLKSAKEWNQYCKGLFSKLPKKPDDIPRNPDQVYEEWTNWPSFLGNQISKFNCQRNFWTFEKAREFVRQLKLKNQKQWHAYCAGEYPNLSIKPLEIPSSPAKKYKNSGWINLKDWLGVDKL